MSNSIGEKKRAAIRHSARRITRRKDLPQARGFARFVWSGCNGEERSAFLQKRDRQVAEAIIDGPVYCASPVRVSDSVLRLRRDSGLPIETEFFNESDGNEKLTFGVYYLASPVRMEGAA